VHQPFVSVIIPSYNRAKYVGKAVESVLDQTFQDLEIIVVDDGSTDDTLNSLTVYKDRVRVLQQVNQGRSGARNAGVTAALGSVIAFLDSDDIWLPEKLERQLEFFGNNPNIGLVHTWSSVIDEHGNPRPEDTRRRIQLYRRALRRGYTYIGMSQECVLFLSTVAIRRECWERIGPFDTEIPAFEDWDWYLRAARITTIASIPVSLVLYRLHGGNTAKDEFVDGRVKTCYKHLTWLETHPGWPQIWQARRNFYIQLAAANYVDGNQAAVKKWMLKAVRLDPRVSINPANFRYALTLFASGRISALARRIRRLSLGR